MKIIISLMMSSLLLAQQGATVGKVERKFDSKANFAALHTYSWTPGLSADVPYVADLIVASCEAEMSKLGFTKTRSNNDVTLAYYTVRSTEVDLEALDKLEKQGNEGRIPMKTLGRLVVVMRAAPPSTRQLWSASTREFMDPDPVVMANTIQTAAARLFETYPGRKAAR